MINNRTKGNNFEDIAVRFLKSKDYEIIDRNFYSGKYGEIDIICNKENKIIFVEVKGRKSNEYGPGELAITYFKKRHLIKACKIWLFRQKIYTEWQIDVIAIDESIQNAKKMLKLRHYKNCIFQNDHK